MAGLYLGIDIGSTTVKVVVLDQRRILLTQRYLRSKGQPWQKLLQAIAELSAQVDLSNIAGVGLTGSGGETVARLIGGRHINELVAQTRAIGEFCPQARTIIEIGGQDSKFLAVAWDEKSGKMMLLDFAMNSLCAAGTGSFLDQQAERLGIAIENEFALLALQSTNPARIAGRCTVFAKSDMIHLQQKGTPLPDILAGLCLALARNFKGVIGKGKAFVPPILFQGGVAYNQGVVWAFEKVLNLTPGELIVPHHHWLMAALGTALITIDEAAEGNLWPVHSFDRLTDYVRSGQQEHKSMPPLQAPAIMFQTSTPVQLETTALNMAPCPAIPVYLGIDVGSISTNVVLIDAQARVVARRYLRTAGKPLEAVRRALDEIGREVGSRVEVCGVGATGSGRYLTGDFVGADVVCNEITAQARAALAVDPTVDTIFEIGGQDSKYIRLSHGAVVDFAMNSACAAGTGSFLEEQADRLKIDIEQDFSRLALSSVAPACLGERCTVFMESDIVHYQQQGAQLDELAAGLAYAIVQNYLNRVVNRRSLGQNIFFQGGVAWNQSVVAAFRQLTGRKITVPPHHDVSGAIGVAIVALEAMAEHTRVARPTKFKWFDLAQRHYQSTIFECRACPNLCEINKVVISGEPAIFYGARCDRFEEAGRQQDKVTAGRPDAKKGDRPELPDLFAEREALLLGNYTPPNGRRNGRLRLAIPRTLIFYDLFPYWRTFFNILDIELVLSSPTTPKITSQSAEYAAVETCFPAKLVYGHVMDLFETEADFIFLPSVINRESGLLPLSEHYYCPFIPAMAHLVTAHLDFATPGHRPLKFPLHMRWSKLKMRELEDMAGQLGVSRQRIAAANTAAEAAQQDFYAAIRRRGREVLDSLNGEYPAAVLVGRPYNTCDLGACQDLPFKLRKLGVLSIPLDFLPLDQVNLPDRYQRMFWRSGQLILAAASFIRHDPRLQAIYVTNFNCGPDSFIINFFRQVMSPKPFLELELDNHTADTGIITRCEAFFDSLRMRKGVLL